MTLPGQALFLWQPLGLEPYVLDYLVVQSKLKIQEIANFSFFDPKKVVQSRDSHANYMYL